MAARRTAYLHRTAPIPEALGDVTVEVYVLWPAGYGCAATEELRSVVAAIAAQIDAPG